MDAGCLMGADDVFACVYRYDVLLDLDLYNGGLQFDVRFLERKVCFRASNQQSRKMDSGTHDRISVCQASVFSVINEKNKRRVQK